MELVGPPETWSDVELLTGLVERWWGKKSEWLSDCLLLGVLGWDQMLW